MSTSEGYFAWLSYKKGIVMDKLDIENKNCLLLPNLIDASIIQVQKAFSPNSLFKDESSMFEFWKGKVDF